MNCRAKPHGSTWNSDKHRKNRIPLYSIKWSLWAPFLTGSILQALFMFLIALTNRA